ncbi:MAG: HNH endonuclease [Planctomycetales bacterium]|nr:HNH endonuclease [Planctomycetales bacterium]
MIGLAPFIANTDRQWFDFLAGMADQGHLDEANFWSPKSPRPVAKLSPGAPVFLRLKAPDKAIAGFGFFAHFCVLKLEEAWDLFGWRNGDPDQLRFMQRIGAYRDLDLLDPTAPRDPLGCMILRDISFLRRERRLPWAEAEGWQDEIVRGKGENDPVRAARLLAILGTDPQPEEFVPEFSPLEADEREILLARSSKRWGQGTFRARLLDADGRRCAITGERTEPVLEAAHIQPYLGPRSNHVQNGLLLTQEFHTLYDRGYVGVTPEHRVIVSPRLKAEWKNGRRYYVHDGQRLVHLPEDERLHPSRRALEWHLARVFKG